MRRFPPARDVHAVARSFALTAGVAFAFAVPAHAQVYKCLDSGGRVTYQQSPCAAGQKGSALTIVPDNGSAQSPETIKNWNSAVADKRVVNGMTRQWVMQALGTPAGKRGPRAGETASEIWVYPSQNEVLRVGFFGETVAWQSRDAAKASAPDTATPGGGVDAARQAQLRDKVAAGQNCDEVRAELGPADREEPVGDAGPVGGPPRGLTGTRYSYQAIDGGVSLAFSCILNKVLDVERGVSTLR
jgi:hypothetical protein